MITFKHIYTDDVPEEVTTEELINEAPIEQTMQQGIDPNVAKMKGAELFARCRAASTAAHFAHLLTSSFAEHNALNIFYEEIVTVADAFAEGFIGRYGKFDAFPNVKESSTVGIQVIGNLVKWITTNRQLISDYSEIQNEIDNIITLCNQTAYKIRELK